MGAASVALAHVRLEKSTPAKDATLAESPPQVTLIFGEDVELKSLSLKLDGEKGSKALGPLPAQDGAQLTVPLPKLSPGRYSLTYVVVGSDLHEMKGTIPFTVAPAAAR